MPNILTKRVDRGFDATIRDASELPRGSAADGSQNVLYSRRTIKTPYGFGKVESGSLPLDSGKAVLALGVFSELDKTQHFLAITESKIYDRNYVTSAWDDVTQSGQALGAVISSPISIAAILHTDGLALNGSGDSWYHHVLVCPGNDLPIQRWAGKFEADFADLVGADDYHTTGSGYTTHHALQVGAFYNRPLLISPKESDASDNLKNNNQRIRWPQAGKLESWKGTGSGFRDLLDTGGYNVWGALLGTQWIQYQNNSIWSLTHVGGTRVFEPEIEMPDLGLLAAHLLYSKNNVHYFVGNDYNIYAYYGGSNIQKLGTKIHRFIQRDLDPAYANRSRLCMGAENSRLWLYIVPNGKTEVTEAYGIDIRTGAWMKRDFTHKWATGGITSVALVGASSYTEGETYAEAVATGKTYADRVTSGETYAQLLETVLTKERLALGDSAGNVYQYDDDLTQDDGVDIPAKHITEVYDLGLPGKNKIWPGIVVTAKGTSLIVSYRTTDFETEDDGWIVISRIWVSPTGNSDPESSWDDEANAYDENQGTAAVSAIPINSWGDDIELTHAAIRCDKIRFNAKKDANITKVTVSVKVVDLPWDVVLGDSSDYNDHSWTEVSFDAGMVTDVRFEFYNDSGESVENAQLYEVDFGQITNDLTSEFVDYEFTVWDTSKKIQFKFDSTEDFQISNYSLISPALEGEV